jgi:hypothetical protein
MVVPLFFACLLGGKELRVGGKLSLSTKLVVGKKTRIILCKVLITLLRTFLCESFSFLSREIIHITLCPGFLFSFPSPPPFLVCEILLRKFVKQPVLEFFDNLWGL